MTETRGTRVTAAMEPAPAVGAGTVLLAAGVLLLCWYFGSVLLLVLAGVTVAVGLDGLAQVLARYTPLRRGWALLIVCVLLLAGLVGVVMTVVPQLLGQFQELADQLVDVFEAFRSWLSGSGWPQDLLAGEDGGSQIMGAANEVLARAAAFGLTTLGALASFAILIALSMFLAVDPDLYRRGLLKLVPPARRRLADDTMSGIAHALRWWFLSQVVSMLLLGVSIGLGLYVIGIELWLALGVLTAVLTFVPYLGPIIAGVPVVAMGFAQGMETGWIVLVFFLVVQTIESNVVVPLIYQKAIKLAPAVTIAAQVALGLVFGIGGFILAAPLTVIGMVMVRKLYIEAVLHEEA